MTTMVKRSTVYVVLSACIVGLGILSLNLYYAQQATLLQLRQERSLNLVMGSSAWLRGIVVSTDEIHGAILVEFVQPPPHTGRGRVLFTTTPDTTISKQELIEENGVYVGLRTPTPITLSTLVPGTRIAVLVEGVPSTGALTARAILAGNPF